MGCITTISGSEEIALGVFFVLWEAVECEHLYCKIGFPLAGNTIKGALGKICGKEKRSRMVKQVDLNKV